MSSVLGPWFATSNDCEYAAVAPTSPEADATFIHSIKYSPTLQSSSSHARGARKQMSKSSYVSAKKCLKRSFRLIDVDSQMMTLTMTDRTSQRRRQQRLVVLGMILHSNWVSGQHRQPVPSPLRSYPPQSRYRLNCKAPTIPLYHSRLLDRLLESPLRRKKSGQRRLEEASTEITSTEVLVIQASNAPLSDTLAVSLHLHHLCKATSDPLLPRRAHFSLYGTKDRHWQSKVYRVNWRTCYTCNMYWRGRPEQIHM
jgi:hypothetical protein